MKYLKKVTLNNFQSHKYSVVEFDEGLNIIVGPSDSGKTAIIRGIKWVLYNEPSGDYFIREGENEASVILEFSSNIKVKRLRSRSKNAYILYNTEGEELVFEGFGNKVPQEIIDLISIKKIPLDSNETNSINIGEQLEGAFLLSEKGSTRASAIGRLIGVDLIDDALKDTLKDIRNISIQNKILQENIEKSELELRNYEYLDNLQENIIQLESIKSIINNKNILKDKLVKILEDYKFFLEEKLYLNNILKELNQIDSLERNILNIENKSINLNHYIQIKSKLNQAKNQIIFDKDLIGNLKNNDIVNNKLNQIIDLKEKLIILEKLKTEKTILKKENTNIIFIKNNLKHLNNISDNVNIMEEKINELKKLDTFKVNLKTINKSIVTGEKYVQKLYNINKIDILYNNLYEFIIKINSLLNFSIQLNELKDEIKTQSDILKLAKKDIDDNLKTYEELLMKNEVCPFCLSIIDESKIDHIIKHYN